MKVIQVLGEEPVSLEEARAHLEAAPYADSDVDPTDDAMIEGWITAAREYCEDYLGLSLSTRILEIALDAFPSGAIELPGGPVREVMSVAWSDDSDGELAGSDYILDTYAQPNTLRPVSSWPSVTLEPTALKVRYLAGYGVDSDGGEAVPKVIKAAILLMLGHFYANREAAIDKALAELPLGVQSLLNPRRVRRGLA